MAPHAKLEQTYNELGLHILAIGCEHPEFRVDTQFLREFAAKFYPSTPALEKVLAITAQTGIESRSCSLQVDEPVLNSAEVPTVGQQGQLFIEVGTKVVAAAARKAIQEWGGDLSDITHVVAASSTAFTNPGYDFFMAKELGLRTNVERILIHGNACSGGMAALRTAANIACGATMLKRPARILVTCLEMSTLCMREELELIHERQEVRLPITLFGDAGTALIVSNDVGLGSKIPETPIYDILGWDHRYVPETSEYSSYNVQAKGWQAQLSHQVPMLSSRSVQPIFDDLLRRISTLPPPNGPHVVQEFDWAVHASGLRILTELQSQLRLTDDHFRASYAAYRKNGSTSSAMIYSVLNELRNMGDGRDNVFACGFGPGIAVETCVLRRHRAPKVEAGSWGCTIA